MVSSIDSIMYNLTQLNEKNAKVTYSLSSGNALEYGSDDAIRYDYILSIQNNISSYESISENLTYSSAFNTASDTALSDIKNATESILAELIQANTDTTAQTEKEIIAEQISAYKTTIYNLANSSTDNQYLFSGANTDTQPFVMDETTGEVTYVSDDSTKKINVEKGIYSNQGVNGQEVFFYENENGTTSSIFDLLDDIVDALNLEDSDGNTISEDEASEILSAAQDKLNDAYDSINISHSLLGTRTNTIENYQSSIEAKLTNLMVLEEEYASADLTTLAVEAQSLENTYTALYSTINRVNSLSLVNYLN